MAKDIMKKLRKSSQKEGVSLSSDMEPNYTTDRDLASDAQQFSRDFDLWYGRMVFGNMVAEIVRKHHCGHTAVNLLDTLDSVIPEYGACLETGYSETAHVRFYRYIGNTRSSLPDKDWSQFLETMSGRVATGCRNLRNEKIPELSGNPVNHSTGESRASTPTTSEGNGEASSSSSPRHQTSASNSFTAEGPPDPVSSLQPPSGIDLAPDAPPTHKYTSALKEHADIYGAVVTYDKNQLSVYPSSWHCVAKFGDFNGEGTGSSYQKAKHNASKQICYKIGLQVR